MKLQISKGSRRYSKNQKKTSLLSKLPDSEI